MTSALWTWMHSQPLHIQSVFQLLPSLLPDFRVFSSISFHHQLEYCLCILHSNSPMERIRWVFFSHHFVWAEFSCQISHGLLLANRWIHNTTVCFPAWPNLLLLVVHNHAVTACAVLLMSIYQHLELCWEPRLPPQWTWFLWGFISTSIAGKVGSYVL